jgi:hypothetical protein
MAATNTQVRRRSKDARPKERSRRTLISALEPWDNAHHINRYISGVLRFKREGGVTRALLAFVLALPLLQPLQQTSAVAPAQTAPSSIIWIGRHADFEEFLRTATIVRFQNTDRGVTHPRHAFFAPGGLAAGAVVKTIRSGPDDSIFDSYRSEIAAYEIDKLLGLDMVPPTVERLVSRDRVSAQLWVEGCVPYDALKGNKPVPDPKAWERQLRRMVAFDNLIVNTDRNQSNMLIDPAGNLVLIDHSRSFGAGTPGRMPYEQAMTAIDRPLLEKLMALDEKTLQTHVRPWVDFGVQPILQQRDAIVKRFQQLIKQNGEANVIFP